MTVLTRGETGPAPFNDMLSLDLRAEGADGPYLRGTRCARCGQLHAGERIVCSTCVSTDVEPCALASRGSVYTYTILGVGPTAPFTFAYVDLDDGVRILAHLVTVDTPIIGMPVRVEFDETGWIFTEATTEGEHA